MTQHADMNQTLSVEYAVTFQYLGIVDKVCNNLIDVSSITLDLPV